MNRILFKNRLEFRDWLTKNALSDVGVWLILDKKGNPETLKANEALEEALCFGWIDGQIQSVDENSYLKYFKQRSKTSKWSEKNRSLVEKLELLGLMTDFGRAKIENAKQNGYWNPPKPEPLLGTAIIPCNICCIFYRHNACQPCLFLLFHFRYQRF